MFLDVFVQVRRLCIFFISIDHFLLNKKLAKKLVAGGVDKHVRGWEKTSDHAPVWIELED